MSTETMDEAADNAQVTTGGKMRFGISVDQDVGRWVMDRSRDERLGLSRFINRVLAEAMRKAPGGSGGAGA